MREQDRIIIDYLNDILESILNIKSFLGDMDFSAFQEDVKTQYAVIRALEIIGEASKKNSQKSKRELFLDTVALYGRHAR